VSPDNLYHLAAGAAYLSALAGQDAGFVYNAAKPLEVTGNYYCCGTTDSRGTYWTGCNFQ
jgi:hypothetical protein